MIGNVRNKSIIRMFSNPRNKKSQIKERGKRTSQSQHPPSENFRNILKKIEIKN
jgi:hypothetical protein